MTKVTALVPMKGNSERVKNKNLRDFSGAPLYHRVVETLRKSEKITDIVINTDSENIKADVNANFPEVIVVNRPQELIGDFVPMNDIIGYDITQVESEIYLQTHSTNPLLSSESIDKAVQFFIEHKDQFDSVFSVTKVQSRFYWEDGSPINHNPQELLRTQDLPPIFEENSCFFLFTRESFLEAGNKRIGVKPKMFEIDPLEAVDIDEMEDFIIAEMLYKRKQEEK